MAFDVHQQIFDEDGQPLEPQAQEYQERLVELFEQSPEAQALSDEGIEGGWVDMMLDFAKNYIGVSPVQMSAGDMHEILFDLIPRKVAAEADEASEIIREFQAFWRFMQREFHLENAAACLSVLDDEDTIDELMEEMGDSDNFGIAKSFFTMGMQRGFDMQSEEGINEWMKTYNAELTAGRGTPIKLPGERSQSLQASVSRIPTSGAPRQSSRQSPNKQKSRMVKASRKKNRKRK
jgi:hypothetical protein